MCILLAYEEGVGSVLVTLLVFKTKGAGYNLSGGFDSHALPPFLLAMARSVPSRRVQPFSWLGTSERFRSLRSDARFEFRLNP